MSTLVDTDVLMDVLGKAGPVRNWSLKALEACFRQGPVVLSSIVWSELAASPLSETELASALGYLGMRREPLSFEASYAAGAAHRRHRLTGGEREQNLPDFLIGAQAEFGKHALLTRNGARYRRHFPTVPLVCPDTFS
jgi:predicted nucleic acid-binding protein